MGGKIRREIQRERNASKNIKTLFHANQDGETLPPSDNPQKIPSSDSDLLELDYILQLLESRENKYLKPTAPNNSPLVPGQKKLSPITRIVAWIKFQFRGRSKIEAALDELRSHNKHLQERFRMQLDLQNQQLAIHQLAVQALQQSRIGTFDSTPTSSALPNPQHLDTDESMSESSRSRRSMHSNATAEQRETLIESASNTLPIGSPDAPIINIGTEPGTPHLGGINETINLDLWALAQRGSSNFCTSRIRRTPADYNDDDSDVQSRRTTASEERWDNCSMNSYVLGVIAAGSS